MLHCIKHFSYSFWSFLCFFEIVFSYLLFILNQVIIYYELYEFFTIFDIIPLSDKWFADIFFKFLE